MSYRFAMGFLLILGASACTIPDEAPIDPPSPDLADTPTATNTASPPSQTVSAGRYETVELVFNASVSPSNPFETYLLKLKVTDPGGKVYTIDGFYDGNGNGGQSGKVWKARISPDKTGTWTWQTVTGDAPDPALAGLSGNINVSASSQPGGIVRSGQYFKFQNGGHLYMVGNFLDQANGLKTTHVFMSEKTTDSQRNAIISRQTGFHSANKANIYFANKGDYGSQSVTPWLGSANSNDKSRMDLARWKDYDDHILRFGQNGMIAEMWFFADDSGFGNLSQADRNRLIRYAMARTSAFSHTMYVLVLEWQEGWSTSEVNATGNYFQTVNPWDRLVSVHSTEGRPWRYGRQSWPF